MAYANTSSAYDFEAFERPMRSSAAPAVTPVRNEKQRNKNNVVQLNERDLRRSHRRNANAARTLIALCGVMIVLSVVGAVVFGQVQLTELTDEIEAYARDRLGMEKVTEGQTTYINLAQTDTGAVLGANEQPGVLKGFWNTICSLFS